MKLFCIIIADACHYKFVQTLCICVLFRISPLWLNSEASSCILVTSFIIYYWACQIHRTTEWYWLSLRILYWTRPIQGGLQGLANHRVGGLAPSPTWIQWFQGKKNFFSGKGYKSHQNKTPGLEFGSAEKEQDWFLWWLLIYTWVLHPVEYYSSYFFTYASQRHCPLQGLLRIG